MSYSDIPFPSLPVVVEPLNAPDFNSPGLEGLDDLGLRVLVNGVVLLDEVVVGSPLGQRVLEIVLRNQLTTANSKIITVWLDSTSLEEILRTALSPTAVLVGLLHSPPFELISGDFGQNQCSLGLEVRRRVIMLSAKRKR